MASMAATPHTPPPAERPSLIDPPLDHIGTLVESDDETISELSSDESSKRFGFTPKRPAKVPRAWERKASTPFAPRTETQKIWKRVPLQDRSSNNAVNIRNNGSEQWNPRAVKRLRVDASLPQMEKDGGGNYINTKYENAPNSARRKVPRDPSNALGNTRNSLSPLRRSSISGLLNEPPPWTPIKTEAERIEKRLEELQTERAGQNRDEPFSGTDAPEVQADADVPTGAKQTTEYIISIEAPAAVDSPTSEPILPEESDEIPLAAATHFFTDSVIFDTDNSEPEIEEVEVQSPQQVSIIVNPDLKIIIDDEMEDQPSVEHVTEEDHEGDLEQNDSHVSDNRAEVLEVLPSPEDEVVIENAIIEEVLALNADDGIVSSVELSKETHGHTETISEDTTGISKRQVLQQSLLESELETNPATSIQEQVPLESVVEVAYESAILQGSPTPSKVHIEEELVVDLPKVSEETSENAIGAVGEQPQQPQSLSTATCEDTAYLHEFLSRARAQKAAKAANSPEKAAQVISSPAKGTRRALAFLSTNGISPTKMEGLELKPDEPVVEDETTEEQMASPCRRSARTRLPKPQKTVPTIPSTIPVRRSNGTEFIFLQRSEAQQVALATRANTKRNKGEAMPPKFKLEALASVVVSTSPAKSPRKKGGRKQVSWNEKLAQTREAQPMEEVEEVEEVVEQTTEVTAVEREKPAVPAEDKPRTRKVKRLGTVNGTPAPKKVMAAPTASELPIPVRRLRTRARA